MNIVTLWSQLLPGRELSAEDTECLRRLTPQGLAKLNHDLLRGISPEETLRTFRRIYDVVRIRRETTLKSFSLCQNNAEPQDSPSILNAPHRFTADELAFLHKCHKRNTLGQIVSSDCVDSDLVENLDLHHLALASVIDPTLLEDPMALTPSQRVRCSLVMTECPADLSSPVCNVGHRNDYAMFQLSPVVSWFNELHDENLEVSVCDLTAPRRERRKEPRFRVHWAVEDTGMELSHSSEEGLFDDEELGSWMVLSPCHRPKPIRSTDSLEEFLEQAISFTLEEDPQHNDVPSPLPIIALPPTESEHARYDNWMMKKKKVMVPQKEGISEIIRPTMH